LTNFKTFNQITFAHHLQITLNYVQVKWVKFKCSTKSKVILARSLCMCLCLCMSVSVYVCDCVSEYVCVCVCVRESGSRSLLGRERRGESVWEGDIRSSKLLTKGFLAVPWKGLGTYKKTSFPIQSYVDVQSLSPKSVSIHCLSWLFRHKTHCPTYNCALHTISQHTIFKLLAKKKIVKSRYKEYFC